MQPYYEGGGATLYLGDCRAVLPTLPKRSVDLLLTDPPYGVNWQSGRRDTLGEFGAIAGDDGSLGSVWLTTVYPLMRPGRHVYVFGRPDLDATRIAAPVELIWDKGIVGLGNTASVWGVAHEYITFGVYTPSQANRADGYGRLAARLRRGSVLRVPRLHSTAVIRHPTEKPVPLLRQLIESSSLMGETVLDPFAGVGSTGVAALLEGRRAILIEIEERYAETAAGRLALAAQHQAALPLEVGA